MNAELILLIYSKYSNVCKQILQSLQVKPLQFIQTLCIDNKSNREKVLSTSKLDIKVVPTILVLLENGTVEKYDGIHALNWIEQAQEHFLPSNIKEDDNISFVQEEPNSSSNRTASRTAIDDLPIVEEEVKELEIDSEFFEDPVVPPPNSTTQEERTLDESTQYVIDKMTQKDNKGNSILAQAQEMAKAREGADMPSHMAKQINSVE